jgi:hypothetical protein
MALAWGDRGKLLNTSVSTASNLEKCMKVQQLKIAWTKNKIILGFIDRAQQCVSSIFTAIFIVRFLSFKSTL